MTLLADPMPVVESLALLKLSVDGDKHPERFSTGFFITPRGTLLTAAHSLTDSNEPNGELQQEVIVNVYDPLTGAWVAHSHVPIEKQLVDPLLDVAVVRVPNMFVPHPLPLAADTSAQEVALVGMQPDPTSPGGFDAHWLACQIPMNPKWHRLRVKGPLEPSLRMLMVGLDQFPPSKGFSGGPVLKETPKGFAAVGVQRCVVKYRRSFRPTEILATPIASIQDLLARVPNADDVVWE